MAIMRFGLIQTYVTVGATFGVIIAMPSWQAALAGQSLPRTWEAAKPILWAMTLATGHGVLRMYSWLPSLIYHLGFHGVAFKAWLFDGW
jgi:hypothetical protein